MAKCNGVNTPGVKEERENLEDDVELGESQGKFLRRIIAIMNYLALDRCDIAFAVKECARHMSAPLQTTERALKRLARYLRDHPTLTYRYKWQSWPKKVTCFTDSDWGGCRRT